jgi:hypothetical protein
VLATFSLWCDDFLGDQNNTQLKSLEPVFTFYKSFDELFCLFEILSLTSSFIILLLLLPHHHKGDGNSKVLSK